MPPKTTSTLSCSTSLAASAAATASSVALSSRHSSRCRPSRPPLALMSPMTILATLALATPDERERARLVGDHSHLDGFGARGWRWRHGVLLALSVSARQASPRVVRRSCSAGSADTSGGLPIFDTPLRLSEFVATLALAQDNAFGQPLESQLRSCLLATSICEAAGFDEELRETVVLGRAAALRRLHRPRPRGRHRLRRRDRDPRPDARARRRESRRGDARRHGLRDGRPQPGGARRDRPDDPGDGPRVGGLQLLVRLRGRRHARAAARLRPRRSRGAALHVRALERQRLSRPRAGARRSRSRCASCT